MIPKIAVINDLSGFGRCSLTAAIPVLSVMGVQACPLPTAVLTAQTGYPSYYCDNYTDRMDYFIHEWDKMNVAFQGIYTGYVTNAKQIEKIFKVLDTFYKEDTFLIADPVMGDDGKTYHMYSEDLLKQMKHLIQVADFATPNLTELCLLTDTSFSKLPAKDNPDELFAVIRELGQIICAKGTGSVIITGIRFFNKETNQPEIGNLYVTQETSQLFSFPDLGGSYSGTGDLFASVLCGGIAKGDKIEDTIILAGTFLYQSLQDSIIAKTPTIEGINFEKYLSLLIPN